MKNKKTQIKSTIILILILIFACNLNALSSTNDTALSSLQDLLDIKINTASKYEQNINEAPSAVSIISSEDITMYGYKTLSEILATLCSFYTRNDFGYNFIGVRGFENPASYSNKILLLVNGHILNENVYYQPPSEYDFGIPMDDIERIEIVRGPGSVLYGTAAMFAVVNVITKDGKKIDGTKARVTYGSFDRYQANLTYGKELFDDFDLTINGNFGKIKGKDYYFKEYDDSVNNYGNAVEMNKEQFYSFFTTMKYKKFKLEGYYTNRMKRVPTGQFSTILNDKKFEIIDQRTYLNLTFNTNLSNDKTLKLNCYYDRYIYDGTYPYDDSTGKRIYQYDSNDGQLIGFEGQFNWDLLVNNRLTAGVESKFNIKDDYKAWYDWETSYYGDFPNNMFSAYIQDNYQVLENLAFNAGIRYDYYTKPELDAVSPRVAIIYNPFKDATLKLLYGGAFRAPNLYELYFRDDVSFKENPNLKPEKLNQIEAVWEQKISDKMFLRVTGYHYSISDLIDQFKDTTDGLTLFRNIQDVEANGFELELNSKVFQNTTTYLNYSFVKVSSDSTDQIINSPRHYLKGGFSYLFFEQIIFALEAHIESERKTYLGDFTPAFFYMNAFLSINPSLFKKYKEEERFWDNLELKFKMYNIFDKKYSLPASLDFKMSTLEQAGRNFYLELIFKF